MKIIPLTKGYEAVVDDEDYEKLVSMGSWHYDRYAKRVPQKKPVYMHRVILSAPDNKSVDHINGNKLDNRKSNLRLCEQSDNSANSGNRTGKYKGVSWDKSRRKWIAFVCYQYKNINLGRFDNAEAAALAYNHVAKQLFGDEAPQNVVAKEVIE